MEKPKKAALEKNGLILCLQKEWKKFRNVLVVTAQKNLSCLEVIGFPETGFCKAIRRFDKSIPIYHLIGAADTLRNNIDVDDTHKYYLLTVEFGIKTYHAYLEWCEEAKEILGEENK